MNTSRKIRLALSIIGLFIGAFSYGQQSKDIVINTKMIEKFNSSTTVVNPISWKEVLTGLNFEDAKLYLSAYQSYNTGELSEEELTAALDAIVVEMKETLNEGLDRKSTIARLRSSTTE